MKEILWLQYKNIFLWSPFVVAFGAALYFSLNIEPNFHYPILICLLLLAIIFKKTNLIIRGLSLFAFGFFYSCAFAHFIDTPHAKTFFEPAPISGVVTNLDYTKDSTRVFMRVPVNQINPVLGSNKLANIRVSISNDQDIPNIGDTIDGYGMIFQPSAKYVPDSFDFARWAYFSQLSGTGFFSDYTIISNKNKGSDVRTYIHKHANSFLTDSLFLGFKQTVPDKDLQVWKNIGIGHIWSISGFHMTMVGGWLFVFFFLIFRSIPYITRRIPAKYPAMICAWCGLLGYLLISGISVATMRAFLMTTLIFIAIIFGRNVLSLRNAVLAFIVIFLINPFYVMSAGFQLSFAAIFGLLWFFQGQEYIKRTFSKRVLHILYASFMTALIATIFTLPFIAAHFGNIPLYGLVGNIILLPIFSFVIMPLIMVGTLLACFDFYWLINVAHDVYNFALNIANRIVDLPYSNIHVPYITNSVLILTIVGLLSLILIVNTDSKKLFLRHLNIVVCVLCVSTALVVLSLRTKPLFYSTSDHELVGFVVDGKLQFNKSRASKHFFAFNSWREFNNEQPKDKNVRFKCKKGLCIYKTPQWNLVYMQNFTAIMDNISEFCSDDSVKYIVASFGINALPNCRSKIQQDGMIIYPNGSVRKIINQRLWHNQP